MVKTKQQENTQLPTEMFLTANFNNSHRKSKKFNWNKSSNIWKRNTELYLKKQTNISAKLKSKAQRKTYLSNTSNTWSLSLAIPTKNIKSNNFSKK